MHIKKAVRQRMPVIVSAAVQPVNRRLSRMEGLLIEMRTEQDVKLRKINKLQQQVAELAELLTQRFRRMA